jgi:anti-anti-sigma factor
MHTHASIRQTGPVSIVDLGGRITAVEGLDVVRAAVKGLVNDGYKHILLNLRDVDYIDSAGLGSMVSCYATLANLGGSLKLLSPQTRVDNLLQITRIYTLLVAFSDEAEALRSFA